MDLSLGELITKWLQELGFAAQYALWTKNVIIFLLILALAYVTDILSRKILLSVISRFTRKTRTDWDDKLLDRRVFQKLAHLVPAVIVYFLLPYALKQAPEVLNILQGVVEIYIAFVILLTLDAFLSALNDIYKTYEISKTKPIKGYIQVVKILLYAVIGIIIVSIIIGKSPLTLLAGLGAMTAVLVLVFKDVILGLISSIQLSANDMVRVGEWISVPQYNADGVVQEITLATVKVQNWDKTISTIPTYAMISDSFQNWRGMQESGGRRIARSLKLDQNSIRFLNDQDLEKLRKIYFLKDYIDKQKAEMEEYNRKHNIDDSVLVNGMRMTNVSVLRAYLFEYLKNHPKVNQQMMIQVRHLEPGEHGLPMQIYCFSREQAWVQYEMVQADIFDHVLAVLPEFDLKVFQYPGGSDLSALPMSKDHKASGLTD